MSHTRRVSTKSSRIRWWHRWFPAKSAACPAGGPHEYVEYNGVGAAGFESFVACVKCGDRP